MRAFLFTALVLVACGKKADAPAPGSGSPTVVAKPAGGSGSATPAPAPVANTACIASDPSNKLTALTADATHATICVARQDFEKPDAPATETCVKLDYASGAYTSAPRPKQGAEPKAIEIKETAGKFEACRPGHCAKLDLPKAKALPQGGDPEKWQLAAHPNGKLAAATGGGSQALVILDADTGKRKKTIPWREGDYACVEPPRFLGDTIYVSANVCAGPGGGGFLFDSDGKKLGQVPNVNVYGATPTLIGGDHYAFSDFGNTKVAIVDVKTGKEVRTVEDPRPEDCDTCEVLGMDAAMWTASAVAKRPDGKLVVGGGTLAIIDPASGKVDKSFRLPACKKK